MNTYPESSEISIESGDKKIKARGPNTILVLFGIIIILLNAVSATVLYGHDNTDTEVKKQLIKTTQEQSQAMIEAQNKTTQAIEKLVEKTAIQTCLLIQPQDKRQRSLQDCTSLTTINR